MTRALAAVLVLLVGASSASAQQYAPTGLSVRLAVGFDGHQQDDLAAWQRAEQTAVGSAGIALQETDAFPSYPSVRVEVGRLGARWNRRRDIRHEVGLSAEAGMTGGRLYYADYSGAFAVDRRARRLALGAYAEHEVAGVAGVWVAARLNLRASLTSVTYRRDVVLGGDVFDASNASFRTVPLSVEPALVAERDLTDRLRFRAGLGYEVSTRSGLGEAPEGLPAEAAWPGAEAPSVGWSGLRVGVGLSRRIGGSSR